MEDTHQQAGWDVHSEDERTSDPDAFRDSLEQLPDDTEAQPSPKTPRPYIDLYRGMTETDIKAAMEYGKRTGRMMLTDEIKTKQEIESYFASKSMEFMVSRVHPQVRAMFVAQDCQGDAAIWIAETFPRPNGVDKLKSMTIEKLEQLFIASRYLEDSTIPNLDLLIELSQNPTETVDAFNLRVRKIMLRSSTDAASPLLMRLYIRALRDDMIRHDVEFAKNVTTIYTAMKIASKSAHNKRPMKKKGMNPWVQPFDTPKASVPEKPKMDGSKITKTGHTMATHWEKGTCFECGQTGHQSWQCPLRPAKKG